MLNVLDDRAEAQWTMVSSLTTVAAQRRASDRCPATSAIDAVGRFLARVRGSSPRMWSNPELPSRTEMHHAPISG